jgi:hypothetical protein
MTLAVYTFASEAYVPALAGLVNSIRRQGFKGIIHIGSPEPLSIAGQVSEGIALHMLGADRYGPTNRKAEMLLAHPSERFIFLDADIIISDPTFLKRMSEWLSISPVFAVEGLMAPVDYRRHMWAKRLGRQSRPDNWPSYYFNAGVFGGIMPRDRSLLEAWASAIGKVLIAPGDLLSDIDFPYSDQDVLNAILQDWEPKPIGIGPPDIWSAASPINPFLHVGTFERHALLHCTGQQKPWRVTRVPDRTPSAYDLAWYDHVILKPIPVRTKVAFSRSVRSWFEQRRWLRLALGVRNVVRRTLGETPYMRNS